MISHWPALTVRDQIAELGKLNRNDLIYMYDESSTDYLSIDGIKLNVWSDYFSPDESIIKTD